MIKYQMLCSNCGEPLEAKIIMNTEGNVLFKCTNCDSVEAYTCSYNIKEGEKIV